MIDHGWKWLAGLGTVIAWMVVTSNWPAIKLAVAETMVAVGIDWPGMGDGDKLNFVVGLGLGAVGLGIGFLGYKVTKRQGEIAEIQHAFFERERSRSVSLSMAPGEVNALRFATGNSRWMFSIHLANGGDRDAHEVNWELRIPFPPYGMNVQLEPYNELTYSNSGESPMLQGLQGARVVRARCQTAVHASSKIAACTIAVEIQGHGRPNLRIMYRAICEEGTFPKSGYGEVM